MIRDQLTELWEKMFPGKGNRNCKGPENGTYLACLRNENKLVWLKYSEEPVGGVIGDDVVEMSSGQIIQVPSSVLIATFQSCFLLKCALIAAQQPCNIP